MQPPHPSISSPAKPDICHLLTLSPELRRLIWTLVIGPGTVLHITSFSSAKSKFTVEPCQSLPSISQTSTKTAPTTTLFQKCYRRGCDLRADRYTYHPEYFAQVNVAAAANGKAMRRLRWMALLFTCRVIYNESVDLVYSLPRFTPSSPDALTQLQRSLNPSNLSHIRHLDLFWVLEDWLHDALNADATAAVATEKNCPKRLPPSSFSLPPCHNTLDASDLEGAISYRCAVRLRQMLVGLERLRTLRLTLYTATTFPSAFQVRVVQRLQEILPAALDTAAELWVRAASDVDPGPLLGLDSGSTIMTAERMNS